MKRLSLLPGKMPGNTILMQGNTMNLTTASMACLAGLLAASSVIAAEPPVFESIYQFDTATYGSIGTLQFGSDGRIYSFTTNRQTVAWSIAPNKTAPDLRFIDNPLLPAQPNQTAGSIGIHAGSSRLARDTQGNLFKVVKPNQKDGTPSGTCPYSGADSSVTPPIPIVNYGFIARFGLNRSVERLSVSTAVPICPTGALAIDTSVTPNMLYFVSEIKAGSNIPAENVGTRLYKMPSDNSSPPELLYQFSAAQIAGGAPGFPTLVVSQDRQWLYGLKDGTPGPTTYLYRIRVDGTGFQQLQKFTPATGWPFSQVPGLVEAGDYLYLSVFAGGPNNNGGLLRVPKNFTTDSELQILHAFNGTDGRQMRSMTLAGDGNIYGYTYQGGPANAGTFFRVRPADVPASGQGGVDANIYALSGNASVDGTAPSDLINGPDGKLYGVLGSGMVFALDIGYVPPAPIFHAFTGTTDQVQWLNGAASGSVTLSWNVENAQSCQLEGPEMASRAVAAQDSAVVTPATQGSNSYRLSCDNGSGLPEGTDSRTFVVTAVVPPPLAAITSFSVTPGQVQPLGTVRFGWATQNAQTCKGSWAGSQLPTEQLNSGWADYKTAGAEGEQTFTLTCTGSGGDTVSKDVTVLIKVGASGDGGGESASISVSDGGGPVAPWLLLPLSLLALRRRQAQSVH